MHQLLQGTNGCTWIYGCNCAAQCHRHVAATQLLCDSQCVVIDNLLLKTTNFNQKSYDSQLWGDFYR